MTESKKESNRSILYFVLRNPVLLFNISLYLNLHERNIYLLRYNKYNYYVHFIVLF